MTLQLIVYRNVTFLALISPPWANIRFYSLLNFCSVYYRGASSLMRGRVCRLSSPRISLGYYIHLHI